MTELRAARRALLARADLPAPALRAALTHAADRFLATLLAAGPDRGPDREADPKADIALVALGGYARRELTPGSDLDVLLVHRERPDVAAVAERVWYPVWDSGVALDHAVRTVAQTAAVAAGDVRAALGLLDARHVAGDPTLTEELRRRLLTEWRAAAPRRLPELVEAVHARWERADELAFLVEPDLKEARGGLRDVGVLRALAAAWLAPGPGTAVRAAATLLLDARTTLHRRTGRGGDRLVHQEQPAVAVGIGLADADALLAALAGAGRTVAYAVDVALRQASRGSDARRPGGHRRLARRPLAEGVVAQDGEVVLARDACPGEDPLIVLRAAAAAAQAGLPLAPHTLRRLRAESAPLPQPWPPEARDALVSLLGSGPALVAVVEALDLAGLWGPLVPEWAAVRNRPQRSPVHRFTVDRHLVEAAAQAGLLARRVGRPDLLLLAALLHDIGKGGGPDHSAAGAALAERAAYRFGLAAGDRATLVTLVRNHLLLSETATGRDLDDPATVRAVADVVRDRATLDLLHALTEADARATGPGVWTDWRASLVADLAHRTSRRLAGAPPPPRPALDARQQELIARGLPDTLVEPQRVTVVAHDRCGLLADCAGVLALHRLEVRGADAFPAAGLAVAVFRVAARFGSPPDPALLASDLRRALRGALDVGERLTARDRAYRLPPGLPPPAVLVMSDASESASVVEVRAHDAPGLLHRVARALTRCGLSVRAARAATMGGEVVDAFYVTDGGGAKLDAVGARRVREAVLAAVALPSSAAPGPPAPAGPPEAFGPVDTEGAATASTPAPTGG